MKKERHVWFLGTLPRAADAPRGLKGPQKEQGEWFGHLRLIALEIK